MKILENRWVSHIEGYLSALSDISGGQREFFLRVSLLEKSQVDLEDKIELILDNKMKFKIIKKLEYKDAHITHFLENFILLKPFTGLYTESEKHMVPHRTQREYKDYMLFHLGDYIDFALEEENINLRSKQDIDFVLMKNNEQVFMVIFQKVEDVELIWMFYQKGNEEEKVLDTFNEIEKNYELNLQNINKEKYTNSKENLNGLSDEINEKLASLLSIIIEKGYIEDDIRSELLKHISLKKISELEDVIFKN